MDASEATGSPRWWRNGSNNLERPTLNKKHPSSEGFTHLARFYSCLCSPVYSRQQGRLFQNLSQMWWLLRSKTRRNSAFTESGRLSPCSGSEASRGLAVFSTRLCVLLSSSTCFCHCVCFPGYQCRTSQGFFPLPKLLFSRQLLATSAHHLLCLCPKGTSLPNHV